jgi:hypothetical protein
MTAIAIRVEHCILSEGRQPGVEGLSKRYRIGRGQSHGDSLRSQRPDTPSTEFTLSAVEVLRTGLRDAMADCGFFPKQKG